MHGEGVVLAKLLLLLLLLLLLQCFYSGTGYGGYTLPFSPYCSCGVSV